MNKTCGNCYMGDECVFRPHLPSNNCAYFTEKTKTGLPPKGENKMIDMVNKPPHYTRDGSMECIDEMIMVFGKEAVKSFCLCNVWKYRYRANAKNGEEDIKKSDWYMRKYRELNEEINKCVDTNCV